jgi:thiol:disulfide interchange protein DsbC
MRMNEPRRAMASAALMRLHKPALAALLLCGTALPAIAQPVSPSAPPALATTGTATTASTAQVASSTSPAAAGLAERLQALYPSTRFGSVNPTPWSGVFEVVMGTNLAYVDATGQYFLFGHFYDMKAQRDLTAERKDNLSRVDFAQLPLVDALKEVRGNGSRMLAIFSDPDCPYCQKLETDLRTLTDVTIHTFLMPLVSLHPGAHAKAVSIWCASNQMATWHAAMVRGEAVPHAECPHPVDRNIALGERLGINGTPTLIAGDGRMLSGAAGKDQIEAWLQRAPIRAHSTGQPDRAP